MKWGYNILLHASSIPYFTLLSRNMRNVILENGAYAYILFVLMIEQPKTRPAMGF
jgi:hypothetical protein